MTTTLSGPCHTQGRGLPDRGSPEWDALVRAHAPTVFRAAYRLTRNQHDAEDLAQDVFVRVLQRPDSYRPGNLDGWLLKVTKNMFLDAARRRRRVPFHVAAEAAERIVSSEPTPDQAAAARTLSGDVRRALSRPTTATPSSCATSTTSRTSRSPTTSGSASAPCAAA